ncbi:MAG: superoxide dismutase [Nocardia sp.]|nr:superoxide dismutase [Nocardia sp.]
MPHHIRRRRPAILLTVAIGLVLAGCGTADPSPDTRVDTAFELPGDRVYPEGIALDERTGDFYIGSYADGTVYRAAAGSDRAEVFLPGGTDGRRTANGLRVDPAGRLWVIDSTAGVAVYDIGSQRPLARFDVTGSGERFVNDIALGPDGSAYLTDSRRHLVYRVTPAELARAVAGNGHGDLNPYLELATALAPHDPAAYTLNGIVADPSGAYLLTVDSTGGDLYRIDLAQHPATAHRVTLVGGDMSLADGLDLHGDTLRAAHNTADTLSSWTLSEDGRTATRTAEYHDDALATPTTLIHTRDRTLVVASQFDSGGPLGPGTPTTPFTVLSISGI